MRNVLVMTYWSFSDALIQSYTLPYVRMIRKHLGQKGKIYLLTLEKNNDLDKPLGKSAVNNLKLENIHLISYKYKPFGFVAFFSWTLIMLQLIATIIVRKISVIHCWATPAGAFGYLLSVVTGRKLILDSYEPHAEAMVENGTWKRKSIAFKILFWLERKQSQRSTTVIAATEGMREYAMKKYGTVWEHFRVKPACVDLNLFSLDRKKNIKLLTDLNLNGKIVCVYAGKFGGIYLDREVFDFFKVAQNFWGDDFRILLLTSHTRQEILEYCKLADLDFGIIEIRFVPHASIPDFMGLADFAITPVRPVPTKRYCTPIKDGEYWAMGLPIVIPSHISDDSDIILRNRAGAVLYSLDSGQYLTAVEKINVCLKSDLHEMQTRIRALAVRYRSFELAERVYESVYRDGFE